MEEDDTLGSLLGGPPFAADEELAFVAKGGFAVVEEMTLGLPEEVSADVDFEFCGKKVEPLCVPGPCLDVRPFRYGSLPAVLRRAIVPGKSFDFRVGKGE